MFDEFDEDGYPTEAALKEITKINPLEEDIDEIIDFLKFMWHWGDMMMKYDKKHGTLQMSTGGWSGNESIISALQKSLFWQLYWYKSQVGGHYWFRIKAIKKTGGKS